MGGAFCPECLGAHFKVTEKDAWQCEVCGWEGNMREFPHEVLMPKTVEDAAKDWEAKKAGKLFYVRVRIEGVEATERGFEVMRALGISGCVTKETSRGVDLTIRFDGALPAGTVEKIQKVKGVVGVRVI